MAGDRIATVSGDEQRTGPASEPKPPLAILSSDIPDSFDDDLGWILSKYVERTGAAGGALTIHHEDGREHDPLFAYGVPAADAGVAEAIGASASEAVWSDRRGGIVDPRWADIAAAGVNWRALSVPVAGDAHCRVVLTTLHRGGDEDALAPSEMMAMRLQPVLAGYFKLWLLNRAQRRRLDGLASALDQTDIAILLLDGAGHIVFLNDAARGLLDDVDGIRRVGRGIAATDMSDAVKLRVAIEHVIAVERLDGRPATGAKSPVVPLRRRGGRRALIAAVLPVERPAVSPADPIAIVYVFTPDINVGMLLTPICQVYGLSPSETRLVGLLAEGLSVAEAAARMRVKVPTLRTYLKQIFSKTGTSRQGDLIRLMMGSLIRTRGGAGHRLI